MPDFFRLFLFLYFVRNKNHNIEGISGNIDIRKPISLGLRFRLSSDQPTTAVEAENTAVKIESSRAKNLPLNLSSISKCARVVLKNQIDAPPKVIVNTDTEAHHIFGAKLNATKEPAITR